MLTNTQPPQVSAFTLLRRRVSWLSAVPQSSGSRTKAFSPFSSQRQPGKRQWNCSVGITTGVSAAPAGLLIWFIASSGLACQAGLAANLVPSTIGGRSAADQRSSSPIAGRATADELESGAVRPGRGGSRRPAIL